MFLNPEEVRNREGAPEFALEKGLQCAASELGSQTVAVLIVEDACIEMVYCQGEPVHPDYARNWPAAAIDWAGEAGPVLAETPAARFLASAVAPAANSFLLFPWRALRRAVIIVFGFAERQPLYP